MTIYVLIHYFEIVGVYSSRENAEWGKKDNHVISLDPDGWHIQEWQLDKFTDATRAAKAASP